jgi:peptide-methionine (R)-S-oxide reductase
MKLLLLFISCAFSLTNCSLKTHQNETGQVNHQIAEKDPNYSNLTEAAYHVCHDKGTEAPYSGIYDNHWKKGTYKCTICQVPLFSSDTKFHSGSGWPSFYNQIDDHVKMCSDTSHGMLREEILCKKCGSHLGHVFKDGPKPTGLRYCVNSVALSVQAIK